MKLISNIVLIAILMMLTVQLAPSQDKAAEKNSATGFRKDFLNQLKGVEEKIMGLAEAIPQESYTWRPMEGVRSVSEVFMHIAGSNYLLISFTGVKPPAGLDKEDDNSITDKAKIILALKHSFAFTRDAVSGIPDADLDNPAKFFGTPTTVRDVIFQTALHMHEHMGQMIAYARSNKIVPPWTAAEQAAEQKKAEKK